MQANQDVLAGPQPTAGLGDVLQGVAERLQANFNALVHDLPAQAAESRPSHLLQFVHSARQQLLRAAALIHDTRKLPPLSQVVQINGVLDNAAAHARNLQTTADELFRANQQLLWQRLPLFNVPDALDVLSTGTYSNLPAAIQDMRGPKPAQEQEQQRLVNQMNHLLYAHLLKAHLPECLQLVEVKGGFAVLRCSGLYEVQLSLHQQAYPPQVAEAREAAREAAAPTAAAAAGDGAAAEADKQQQVTDGKQGQPEPAAAAADVPTQRWQWALTHAVLLPNAAMQQPLRPVQYHALMHNVQERMWLAADAAAVEAVKRQQGGGAAAAAADGKDPQQRQPGMSQPAMSGMVSTRSGPTASTVTGLSGSAGAGTQDPQRGLQLDVYGADEVALPLRVMHSILRDIAAQILLQEVRRVSQQLAGASSKWGPHLKLARAEQLTPGIRMLYWQHAPVLLPLAEPAAAAAAGTAAAGTAAAASKGDPGSIPWVPGCYPAVEVGVGADGTVQQLHMPPLQLPGTAQPLLLQLDSHRVDVVGLLLQAVQVVVAHQLQFLHGIMTSRLQDEGSCLQLRLCRYRHLSHCTQQQQQQPGSCLPAAAGLSELSEAQQQQRQLQQQLPDSLEVLVEGQPALTISFQPWSGRLVLRLGSAYGGDSNMEMGISLHQHQEALRVKQERRYQQLQQQLQGSTNSTSSSLTLQRHQQEVVLPCLQELAAGLSDLCSDLLLKQRYNSLVTAARMLSLNPSHYLRSFLSAEQQQLLRLPLAAAAAAAGSKGRASRTMPPMYLAMPCVQLPPYMQLLAAGSWCGAAAQAGTPGRQQSAAAARQPLPAHVATLNPVLCLSFPRQPAGGNNDGLLLILGSTQGLPGPLLKELQLPALEAPGSSSSTGGSGSAPAAAAAAQGSGIGRKRQRDDSEAPEQQQQQEQQPQQQQQPQQGGSVEQLSVAVQYCKLRLTYERLLLELAALQVDFVKVKPSQVGPRLNAHTAGASNGPNHAAATQHQQQQPLFQAPVLLVTSIPGVSLYEQHERPHGCSPAAVGLTCVWIQPGAVTGQWSLQLAGTLYKQQQQGLAGGGAAGPSLWHWQCDFTDGGDVRTALLQLQRVVHMQRFLCRLECLTLGKQQLDVVQRSRVSALKAMGCEGGAATDAAVAGAADAAAAVGVDDDAGDSHRPVKKARCSQDLDGLPDGVSMQMMPPGWADGVPDGGVCGAAASNGLKAALPRNGVLQPAAAAAGGQAALANGDMYSGAAAGCGTGAAASGKASSSGSSLCGLLWHWPETGLVRLAGYNFFEAVLQCSPPLTAAAAAGSKQQQSSRAMFHICWQPLYGFGAKPQQSPSTVQPSVGLGHRGLASGSAAAAAAGWPSSSNTTSWVDVHAPQTQQPADAASPMAPPSSSAVAAVSPGVVSAQDVLSMGCCVGSSCPQIPEVLLAELADMVDTHCEGHFLDAVALLGGPLCALKPLLAGLTPSKVGALLARATKQDAGSTAVAGGGTAPGSTSAKGSAGTCAPGVAWWPSVVTSAPAGAFHQIRLTVGAQAPLPPATQQQQQQQQQQGKAPGATQGGFVKHQLLLDLSASSGGRVKVAVRQQRSTTGHSAAAAEAAASDTPVKQEAGAPAPAAAAAVAASEAAPDFATSICVAAWLQLQRTHPGIHCVPAFGPATWQRQIVPQFPNGPPPDATGSGSSSSAAVCRREPLSGFWVAAAGLQVLLSSLLQAWTHHVVTSPLPAPPAAAPAAAAGDVQQQVGGPGPVAVQAGDGAAGGAVSQQQQQQQPVQVTVQQQQAQAPQQHQQPPGQQHQQVLQPEQQAALQQAAAANSQQQLQQQQNRLQGQQGAAATAAVGFAAAPAAQGAAVQVQGTLQGPVQAMAVSMPVALHQNVAVTMPISQMGGVQFVPMPGVQQHAGAMMPGAGWGRPVHGIQQQQHPAQQQQQQHRQ